MTYTRVNDVHSALNQAEVVLHKPESLAEIPAILSYAREAGAGVAVCGGRHAMGGQQFADKAYLVDLRACNRVLELDIERGFLRAESGIQWRELVDSLVDRQSAQSANSVWGIAQKQTGADSLTLGGALAANAHGRGLLMAPIVADVESFTLILASGETRLCSRNENADLFSIAIGGYGLFGVFGEITLRLTQRVALRRMVRVIDIEDAVNAAARRISEGYIYGDFQFDIDPASPDFLTKGVFSAYVPTDDVPPGSGTQKKLTSADWINLLHLAHSDKSRAFNLYAQHYLATDGQIYWSDLHQLSEYTPDYHAQIDNRLGSSPGSEMITELYVPHEHLVVFLRQAARILIERSSQVIYGTIRLIQPDDVTVLRWATQPFACIIFNLHVDHSPDEVAHAAQSFRELIDLAIGFGGSYFLTYHRWATPAQFEACYPRVREFFAAKKQHDPEGLFTSDWHRHYAPHFVD